MRIVCDTDIVSTFARIRKIRLLTRLFDNIIIPPSVNSELKAGRIIFPRTRIRPVKLTKLSVFQQAMADSTVAKGMMSPLRMSSLAIFSILFLPFLTSSLSFESLLRVLKGRMNLLRNFPTCKA